MRPHLAEREEINRIIMDELVRGVFKPEAVAYFQKVIGRLKTEGCDAVVLGCTEIPLIMNDANSPLPTLDSTRLLARAALKRAIARWSGGLSAAGLVAGVRSAMASADVCRMTASNRRPHAQSAGATPAVRASPSEWPLHPTSPREDSR